MVLVRLAERRFLHARIDMDEEADARMAQRRGQAMEGRGVRMRDHPDGEAGAILRRRDWKVLVGAVGYWAFDNAVLWATFQAIDVDVPLMVILLGYLIGQLGGLLPLPGGVGGIDGGLIGTLIVFGAPAAATAGAVLIYRVILFWVPLLIGAVAFASLRRSLSSDSNADLRAIPPA